MVIGAGFGGLALAIRLQAAGMQTTLLEKRDKPGGRAYVYEDQGFTFDAGPTVITDPTAIEELFTRRRQEHVGLRRDAAGGAVLPPVLGRRHHFDYANDQESLDRQIHARNPDDVAGYQRFLAYSKAVFEEGYLKLGAVPFLSFRDMIAAGPQLARLQAWRSVYSMVSRFIEDDHLRQAFSFHSLLVGGNPFATSSIYTLIHALERRWGVWFPRGGTGALVQALVRLFEDLGGRIELNAPVARIDTSGNRATGVRLDDGRVLPAQMRGLERRRGAHLRHPAGPPPARRGGRRRALRKKRFSNSLFVMYFGLEPPP